MVAIVDSLRSGEVAMKYDARLKMCYENCQIIAFEVDDLTYVEGWAIEAQYGLPLEHAWLVDGEGNIVDPTWWKLGKLPRHSHYFPANSFSNDEITLFVESGGSSPFTVFALRNSQQWMEVFEQARAFTTS
jgi:hypothetical protein